MNGVSNNSTLDGFTTSGGRLDIYGAIEALQETCEDLNLPSPKGDLAIIKIKDDGFYNQIFAKNESIINLYCSDKLEPYDKASYIYHLYGYPSPPFHKKSIAKILGDEEGEELYGMKAESLQEKDGIEMYVKKGGNNNKMLLYNAIDTEKGQSGSAIFIEGGEGTYHIVGTHICGTACKNYGVALNKDKMDWINNWIKLSDTTPLTQKINDNVKSSDIRPLPQNQPLKHRAIIQPLSIEAENASPISKNTFKIRVAIDFGTDGTGTCQRNF